MVIDAIHELQAVNAQVNHAYVWGSNGRVCSSYAFDKETLLLRGGFPKGALHLANVTDEKGEPHMILIADADGVRWALDNRFSGLRKWSDLQAMGYQMNTLWASPG